jgi:hypothetical protein
MKSSNKKTTYVYQISKGKYTQFESIYESQQFLKKEYYNNKKWNTETGILFKLCVSESNKTGLPVMFNDDIFLSMSPFSMNTIVDVNSFKKKLYSLRSKTVNLCINSSKKFIKTQNTWKEKWSRELRGS